MIECRFGSGVGFERVNIRKHSRKTLKAWTLTNKFPVKVTFGKTLLKRHFQKVASQNEATEGTERSLMIIMANAGGDKKKIQKDISRSTLRINLFWLFAVSVLHFMITSFRQRHATVFWIQSLHTLAPIWNFQVLALSQSNQNPQDI